MRTTPARAKVLTEEGGILKDVMSLVVRDRERARPPQLKRDDRRAGVQTVELEEASGEHRNGT
jgi:hypothetical protein